MNEMIKDIACAIDDKLKEKDKIIVAIDGRCGAGKTTLASELEKMYDCNIIHMDEFFLRPPQRTQERLEKAGENIDHERFLKEVLLPMTVGSGFSYCPYSCAMGAFAEEKYISCKRVNIIEGTYSCHDNLYKYYDIRVFLSVDKEEQMTRIVNREGCQKAQDYKNKWIPLEEKYFRVCEIEARCELIFV